ncbi:MAG: hypothetical protein K2L76_03860 [Muribaculaceae bacterium]|nr:hypothetical protein [Muribaculaceae bacterium]
MTHNNNESGRKAQQTYPGAATDSADSNKVTEKLVDERTCTLNNNPRTGEHDATPAAPPADN